VTSEWNDRFRLCPAGPGRPRGDACQDQAAPRALGLDLPAGPAIRSGRSRFALPKLTTAPSHLSRPASTRAGQVHASRCPGPCTTSRPIAECGRRTLSRSRVGRVGVAGLVVVPLAWLNRERGGPSSSSTRSMPRGTEMGGLGSVPPRIAASSSRPLCDGGYGNLGAGGRTRWSRLDCPGFVARFSAGRRSRWALKDRRSPLTGSYISHSIGYTPRLSGVLRPAVRAGRSPTAERRWSTPIRSSGPLPGVTERGSQ
jgi:hypothetical protein